MKGKYSPAVSANIHQLAAKFFSVKGVCYVGKFSGTKSRSNAKY
jgi:hypothetical protein